MNFLNDPIIFSSIIFLAILAFYLWYTFATIYHFIRFGSGVRPKIAALIFLAGSLILFVISIQLYSQIDWSNIFSIIKQ